MPKIPGIVMANLSGFKWGALSIPCDAESMLTYGRQVGGSPIHLMTESDGNGRVLAWKLRMTSLTFEFEPNGHSSDPRGSRLLSSSFNYRLPYSFAINATFT